MAKKKIVSKKTTSSTYWLVPAVLTVLVGCAIMWYWSTLDMKEVELEEQMVLPVPTALPSVEGASTSEEIDAMFKKIEQTAPDDDLSDLEQ
ncbi:hypothetical protein KBD09_00400 [Candidatus Woesebacteria bacterium]|nr:hypothetical protein [Candidatus Woesebacteria bacterium]